MSTANTSNVTVLPEIVVTANAIPAAPKPAAPAPAPKKVETVVETKVVKTTETKTVDVVIHNPNNLDLNVYNPDGTRHNRHGFHNR